MTGAEFTHVGEDCTFQTLLRRFGLDDPALAAIGEIVHDIDCKDEKFARPETAGVLGVLRGIARQHEGRRRTPRARLQGFRGSLPVLLVEAGRSMKWITRERPKIDRIACP